MEYGVGLNYSQNGIITNRVFEHYKTLKGLKCALNRFCEKNKAVILGYCFFSFSGNENKKYSPSEYTVIERYNYTIFFDYWR